MTGEQLQFFDYCVHWPIQMSPQASRKKCTHKPSPQVWPQPINRSFMQALVKLGQYRYPLGHSRHARDNPHQSDDNQSCWLALRQMPFCGMSEHTRRLQIAALLQYGFLAQRIDSYGPRYRVSKYGQLWLLEDEL